jgi:7-cyano-7-deazaguanine synthase
MKPKAVCLLSGGLDSSTCLGVALRDGFECYALSFDYGQRHAMEVAAAVRVAHHMGAREQRTAKIDLRVFGGSALTDSIAVPKHTSADQLDSGIPVTYVPAPMRSIIPAIQIAGPSIFSPLKRWPT